MSEVLIPEQEQVRALLAAVLDNHTYFGDGPEVNMLRCASCSGYVAFPGGRGTAHTADCPVPKLRRLAAAPAQEGKHE